MRNCPAGAWKVALQSSARCEKALAFVREGPKPFGGSRAGFGVAFVWGFRADPRRATLVADSMDIFAAGQEAVGLIAIGRIAAGVMVFGQVTAGGIAVGQLARGVTAIGQLAIGICALGMLNVPEDC